MRPPLVPIREYYDDDETGTLPPWPEDIYAPRRRRVGAWLLGVAMVVTVGIGAYAAERRFHLVARVTSASRSLLSAKIDSHGDSRAEAFVAEGERALAAGDLESAQGDFDKASVLVERDPRVLLGAARVAAAKADVPWLKARLLPADATDEARTTSAELDERVAIARRAADQVAAATPQDPRALVVKLDALRLSGDVNGARAYVVAVFSHASEPETAYALAALDLAQPDAPLAAAIDRLRIAAPSEGAQAGRAGAALVYALMKAGDAAGAKAALSKLESSPRPYPLVPNLRAWIERSEKAVPAAPASASPADSAQPPAAASANESAHMGSQDALTIASNAMADGDWDRAERIYRGILVGRPNDSQALTGLAEVLRDRGDPWSAIDTYQRAIDSNPSYLPAFLGLADTQWVRGDHDAATRTYKRIQDRFPEGTYPVYVSKRAAGQ